MSHAQSQSEFFIQRMGGPDLFSQRKGHPALIGRHTPFAITAPLTKIWLGHMEAALDVCLQGKDDVADARERIWAFMRHTAYFIQGGVQTMHERQKAQQ